MGKLTPKQERFVQEYLVDLNGTQAAIRAGYSIKTANEQAARLLANVSVKDAVQAKQKRLQVRTEVTQERIIAELAKVAFDDVQDDETGLAYRDQHKMKALELLGKHLGMYTDKIDANVTGAMTVVFDKSMEDDE